MINLIEKYNNSPPGLKYFYSLLQAFAVGVMVWLTSLIDLKGLIISLTNIPHESLGIFFYWEIAGIIHTALVFVLFTYSKELDDMTSANQRKTSFILISLTFAVILLLYYHSLWHMKDNTIYYFLRDSISYAPLCIFFLANLIFLLINSKKEAQRNYFLKMILMLDLPFVIPYLLVLFFAINYIDDMGSVHNYLAGVASTVLISSNFVTAAFSAYKEKPKSDP